jgi:hypothetical protein
VVQRRPAFSPSSRREDGRNAAHCGHRSNDEIGKKRTAMGRAGRLQRLLNSLNIHGGVRRAFYNSSVNRYHVKAFAAGAAALFAFLLAPNAALAQNASVTVPVSGSPVVRVQMRSGTLTIRTWNQPQVQVSSSDAVQAQHYDAQVVDRVFGSGDIPIFSTAILTPQGPLLLPPEEFPIGPIGGGHDAVVVHAAETAQNVVITVPAGAAFVWAAVGRGEILLNDYRNGSFVARVRAGRIGLRNVGGNGYVEVARGPISVRDSALNRLRARTAIGNILFENCNARQIEVSSIEGSVAYDNGTFAPGLARFESQNGDVAIGIAGGSLQIGAHSAGGKIFESLPNARVAGSDTDAQASLGSGGPVVTASSMNGNVYLYRGAFKKQRHLSQWRAVERILHSKVPQRR